ncbi:MAG: hypothetical protein HC903_24995 [Methylacidiphilales bacterium]|nr:hypothetical protein [Candidatus Methylacidiphilales bacterium]
MKGFCELRSLFVDLSSYAIAFSLNSFVKCDRIWFEGFLESAIAFSLKRFWEVRSHLV